jgi:hypothetical protein
MPLMQRDLWRWTATALAGLSVVLVAVNAALVLGNQATQAEFNRRQQLINENVQLGRANTALVRALATAAVGSQDAPLRQLLAGQGITINPAAPAADAVPPATAVPSAPAKSK